MSRQTIEIPDLGDIEKAEVIEIHIKEGDFVTKDQMILLLESEKATLEVPASISGKISELQIKQGQRVKSGDAVAVMETEATAEKGEVKKEKEGVRKKEEVTPPEPELEIKKEPEKPAEKKIEPRKKPELAASAQVHAGPAVRRLANQLGVVLSQVSGGGPKGRILKEDVHAYVRSVLTQKTAVSGNGVSGERLPEIDFSQWGPVTERPLNNIQKTSAWHLHRTWNTVPQVTQFDRANITDLEQFRKEKALVLKEQGVKLTLLAFLVKACAYTLNQFPKFKTSLKLDGETLVFKEYCHIGVAVDTPNGLLVPVIQNADQKSVIQLSGEIVELSHKAREKRLAPGEMKGGCFSISSLGGIGGTGFTPIVNWPQTAILGVSRSSQEPVWQDGQFVPRLMLPLALSYDHRVIDGADAARFTRFLSEVLSDIRQIIL